MKNNELKKYPKYKLTGIEWLDGDASTSSAQGIPEEWEINKLKYSDAIIMGQSPNSEDYSYTENGLPFIQGNAEFTKLYPEPKLWCSSANKVALPDDVLLSVRAPIGAVNIANQKIGIGRGLCSIRPKLHNKKYLYYFILCSKEELNSIGTGSTYTAVSAEEVKNLFSLNPSNEEQTAIANYLDDKTAKIDTLIEKKKKLIELLKEERTAVINQAVTRSINPAVKLKESGIEWLDNASTSLSADKAGSARGIPEHWEVKKLKYVAKIFRGKFTHRPRNDERLYNGDFPFIQTGEVARAEKYLTTYTQTLNEEGFKVSTQFPRGTLLMTIAANIGEVAILGIDACFPDSIVGFYPFDFIDNEFLFYKLKTMTQIFLSTSVMNTQMNLNVDRISFVSISFPSKKEQHQIVQHIESETKRIDRTISKIEREIELLAEYRTALISEVVTGKIKVI